MTVEITKKPDFKKLNADILSRIQKGMERAAVEAASEISRRTRSGIDASGEGFKDYTPEYKAYKVKKGRSGNVDLTFTGSMLRAIQSQVKNIGTKIQARIYFSDARQGLKAIGNMKKRRFFAFSREQVTKITQTIKDAINANR